MKYCKNCGKQLEDDVKFCSVCGADQDAENVPATAAINPTNNNGNNYANLNDASPKSRTVAAILAFFLGGFGAHNFYLGKTGCAIAQLLLTVIGWMIIIGPFISGIWAFVEFIIILCGTAKDKDGLTVSSWAGDQN